MPMVFQRTRRKSQAYLTSTVVVLELGFGICRKGDFKHFFTDCSASQQYLDITRNASNLNVKIILNGTEWKATHTMPC